MILIFSKVDSSELSQDTMLDMTSKFAYFFENTYVLIHVNDQQKQLNQFTETQKVLC